MKQIEMIVKGKRKGKERKGKERKGRRRLRE